jgi:MoaA/NifB/PqqE/SkfB family radical SAM enzyme
VTTPLEAIAAGVASSGPRTVHIDVTNACNAACITCWDHSPLLHEARPASWKKKRIDLAAFDELVDDLATLGSVKAVILSGMGDPLVHPDIYTMIDRVKARGWHLTVMTNLIAADIDRLAASHVDQILVGVHGATPTAYSAFHPGWDEREFFTLCKYLRVLATTDTKVRHVQVINRDTASDVVDMIRFAKRFRADRVNYKLASLAGGTETCRIDETQRRWLILDAVPAARELARELDVPTNLDLFSQQLVANVDDDSQTVPIDEVGCFMGYVYTRITASGDVLYCCNTEVRVGSLADARFTELWRGPAWQALRTRLRRGDYFPGCARCGKFEQNMKWSRRVKAELGDAVWRDAIGANRTVRLRVV